MHDFNATLEKHRIEQAALLPVTRPRSLVAAVHQDRNYLRFQTVESLLAEVQDVEHSKSVCCLDWLSFSEWLTQWLICTLGLPSRPDDPQSIESLLEALVSHRPSKRPVPRIVSGRIEIPAELIPPDYWISLFFEPQELGEPEQPSR